MSHLRGALAVITGGTALPRCSHTNKTQWRSENTVRNATVQNSHSKVPANRRACTPTVCLTGTRRFTPDGGSLFTVQPMASSNPEPVRHRTCLLCRRGRIFQGIPPDVFIKQERNAQAAGSLAGSSCSLRLWGYRLLSPGYGVIAGLPGTVPPQNRRKHIQGAIRPFASGTWVWTGCGTWMRTITES